jgi:hypothetical protein
MEEKLIITPKTKVLQLIEAYPQLEEVLIGLVPAFSKLKNPILRKTVARITNLQQAAQVGDISIDLLINTLRKAIGQDSAEFKKQENQQSAGTPAWFDASKVFRELDARPMLAAGEHPVAQVLEDLKQMPAGKIYLLIAPFLPAPLIDKASSLGALHFVVKEAGNVYKVYFMMP